MARTAGRDARLWAALTNTGKATPIGSTRQFGVSSTRKKLDATCQGDNSEVFLTGLPGGQGSYAGVFDDSDTSAAVAAALDGLTRAIYGYLNASLNAYFYCTALFDVEINTSVDGLDEVKGTWSAATPVFYVGV